MICSALLDTRNFFGLTLAQDCIGEEQRVHSRTIMADCLHMRDSMTVAPGGLDKVVG